MKRKFIAVLVATSLAITSLVCSAPINVYAENNTVAATSTLQNVGDELYGFKVIRTDYKENTKSKEILVEHVQTGAKMLIIKNNDLNRGFSIGFDTPAENDKGINHILEHSLLGGSEKYPTNNMIFNVMNSTYTSFINAFTGQNTTMFPVCSQNEDQLMKLTDIYMDAVYHPLIAKDKRIFEREAWRYELEDENSPLTVNGVVYNEMRGNYGNIDRVRLENDKKTIFSDTNQGYESGGEPNAILDLSYEEFLNTYKKNYTPANSFMVLYGDVNYENFLKMINDNYLSSYKKEDINIDRHEQPAFSNLVVKDYDFPVAKDTDTTNKSKVDIVFALPDVKNMSLDDVAGTIMIASLLQDDNSEFYKSLRASGIAENYSTSMSIQTNQPVITIKADNADPSKKMEFYNLVNKQLKEMVSKGVDKELAKSVIASIKFEDLQESEQGASNKLISTLSYNNIFDDPTADINSYVKNIEGKLNDEYLEGLITKYLLQNTQVALVTTNPKAGLLEENTSKLQEELKKKKDSMSKEEKDALIKETKEFKEWNGQETSQDVINSLKAVTSKDIPIELKDYNIQVTSEAGVKVVTADANISDYSSTDIVFDESHLSKDELFYLEFYKELLNNQIPTKNRNESQLTNAINSKTANYGAYVSADRDDKEGKTAHPVFGVSYYVMNEDCHDVFDLVSDTLLNTNLDGDISDYIKKSINGRKQSFSSMFSEPNFLSNIRAAAYNNQYYRYINYLQGLDYYNFILNLEKDYNNNPQSVINKIKEVRDKAFSKKNVTVLFAGNKDSQTKLKNELSTFTSNLSDKTYDKASYELPIPEKREALTTNSQVQYIGFNSSLDGMNDENDGNLKVLAKILEEKVLLPEIRLKGGAYGAGASTDCNEYLAYSFRDNDFVNSLGVINKTQDYMSNILPKLTAESLDNYIISTFATETNPVGELSGAQNSLNLYLNNTSNEDIKNLLQEIKDTNLDQLKNSPEILEKLNENANYVVAGSPEQIEAHKDMFDKVIPLK